MPLIFDKVRPIYRKGDSVYVLDQLALPGKTAYQKLSTPAEVERAIKTMVLRGAPLIGVAAAYGYALSAKGHKKLTPALQAKLARDAKMLLNSRPTAVNLKWGIEKMGKAACKLAGETGHFYRGLIAAADQILREDIATNLRMAAHGAKLLPKGARVLTICNTGALATAGVGTALGVVRMARKTRKLKHVWACETRPYLQGARLTMWELKIEGIPAELITDGMAAHIMKTEKPDAVLAGADRVAANGDAANKIGTYGLAILAKHHGIPFYIVAPSTTVDLSTPTGAQIPIEERSESEVIQVAGRLIAPKGTRARHPAFDATPASLITAIVTEKGVVKLPNKARLAKVMARP